MKWNKHTLLEAVNQRVDKGLFGNDEFLMPVDVSDDVLAKFQELWDGYTDSGAQQREKLYKDLYEFITKK